MLLIFSVFAKFASFQIRINIISADWKMESLIVIKKSLVQTKIEIRKILCRKSTSLK